MPTSPRSSHRRPHPLFKEAAATQIATPLSGHSRPPRRCSPADCVLDPLSNESTNFEDAYRQYNRRIYRLCLRMVRNPAEAEDLMQDAFLQAFQKRHQFQGRAAFSTWLHRVAVNVVLMRLRKRSLPATSLDEILSSERSDHRDRCSLVTADARQAGTIDRVLLEKAIRRLPSQNRYVFILYEIEGYQHQEIAKLTGYSVSSSKSNLHRARLRLRELLAGQRLRQTV
jgi:RNA polymerase sigma-70 factor, ECF subfamily